MGKTVITGVSIIIGLTVLFSLEAWYTGKSVDYMNKQVLSISAAVQAQAWEEAGRLTQEASHGWERQKKGFGVMVRHSELEGITDSLTALTARVREKNAPEADYELTRLTRMLQHLEGLDGLNLSNLF